MPGDSGNVLHQFFRFLKDLPIDLLKDHLNGPHLSDPISKHIGFVDMPASAGAAGNQFSGKCKLIRYSFYLFFWCTCHFTFSFPDSSKKHTVRKQICFILFAVFFTVIIFSALKSWWQAEQYFHLLIRRELRNPPRQKLFLSFLRNSG